MFRQTPYIYRSSLFYKMRARNERHKCDTNDTSATQVPDTSDMSVTRVLHERHECDTSGKRTTTKR